MTAMTKNNRFIHWAIERQANDGPFVTALTHDTRVVRCLMAAWQAEWDADDEAPRQRAIPFEAGQEVWLGFPFNHKGAKEWRPDDGFGTSWPDEEEDVLEAIRQGMEHGWL